MNPDEVRELEEACETQLRKIVEAQFEGVPDHTFHLMAKAAVTVLEAAISEES